MLPSTLLLQRERDRSSSPGQLPQEPGVVLHPQPTHRLLLGSCTPLLHHKKPGKYDECLKRQLLPTPPPHHHLPTRLPHHPGGNELQEKTAPNSLRLDPVSTPITGPRRLMVTTCCQGGSPRQTLPGQGRMRQHAWAESLGSQMSGQKRQEAAPGEGRVSETSKLTLLATASSPLGKGQEDPTSQSLLH